MPRAAASSRRAAPRLGRVWKGTTSGRTSSASFAKSAVISGVAPLRVDIVEQLRELGLVRRVVALAVRVAEVEQVVVAVEDPDEAGAAVLALDDLVRLARAARPDPGVE